MSTDGAYSADPWVWFRDSFARAADSETFDAARAALATASADGQPSVRFVLVKQADEHGFVFYTNFESAKARDLLARPRAALAFHWSTISEQVRAEGPVERVSDREADAYFDTRPRGSQLAAWASRQSAPIADRVALQAQFEATRQRFAHQPSVARPPFWGGFRLAPVRIEFWRGRDDRLHDRWSFERAGSSWQMTRLQP